MSAEKTYRIRTTVGRNDSTKEMEQCINVPLKKSYETLEIMSLKLNQTNSYKYYASDYGVIVGRVIANGGFGVPNAKISIFIEVEDNDSTQSKLLYNFINATDRDNNGVRYNLLPDSVDSACHQPVGTFPNKRLVLDNKDEIEIFEKYWKYTTTTNQAGDYMLFGVPTGMQMLHMDLDLSDCGVLSQRPRDMVAQGYNIKQFESPNKFKQSTDLKSLAQIVSQDQGVYVHPYWGETTESGNTIAVTRCDIELEYKFEPTCIFIGSMITDKGSNAIGKNCTGNEKVGKMSDMATGEGMIEMIRKTIDNRVEEYPIQGNRLIDGDGVWCYQIPMNLDYVMTDEFGNMVPTDNPNKGIPTRTRVRFRMTMDESPDDATARKRCRYLVPNNPRVDDMNPIYKETHEVDYEFGSSTREESYRDLFWNKVYTVKSYIPRLQKNRNITNRKHTGIKLTNHFGDNNPMPYNSLTIKLSFMYRLICVLVKVIVYLISFLNMILGIIVEPLCWICNLLRGLGKIWLIGFVFKLLSVPFCKMVISCIKLSSEFCDDGINKKTYFPGCIVPCQKNETHRRFVEEQAALATENPEEITVDEYPQMWNLEDSTLVTCIENSLAQENDATSFNFVNDWINGVLYAPLWFRFIRPKKKFLFGLFTRKAKDQWCDANKPFNILNFQTCSVKRIAPTSADATSSPLTGEPLYPYTVIDDSNRDCGKKGNKCHETKTAVSVNSGLIVTRPTMLNQTVYYYKPVEYDAQEDNIVLLFATDIVLLGSLNDCDLDGIPQFYRNLEPTTFNQPTDILFTDTQIAINDEGQSVVLDYSTFTEATGADWGNLNETDECGKMGKNEDGGLFYGIGCSSIEMMAKTVLNVPRICEFGVALDARKEIPNLIKLEGSDDDDAYDELIPDGYVSFDEIYNPDGRSMFATLNGNRLRTRLNRNNGLPEYEFRHYYIDNFDGGLYKTMQSRLTNNCNKSYKNNYHLERYCPDYYLFRMGEKPYFYNSKTDPNHRFPRYENSFYFYFGLKNGKTAIEKFNSQFFAPCETVSGDELAIGIEVKPNDWCSEMSEDANDKNGYVKINLTDIATPFDIIINNINDSTIGFSVNGITDDKIVLASERTYYVNPEGDDKVIDDMFDGYQLLREENHTYTTGENGNIIILPNGEYEVTITDADGNIMSAEFTTNANKLTFSNSVIDFTTPNNQKIAIYNSSNDVINDALTDLNISENKSKIGGVILITNIYDPSTPDSGIYRLTIKPSKSLVGKFKSGPDFIGYSMKFKIQNGIITPIGTLPNLFRLENVSFTGGDGSTTTRTYIAIGVPYGDIEYIVTITQLCDDFDSPNFSKANIKVNDPVPYKLYVNDVDTEIFKTEKFPIEWNIKKYNDRYSVPSAVNGDSGWLHLATDDGKYDWDAIPEYVSLIEELEEFRNGIEGVPTDEENEQIEQLKKQILQFKIGYIDKIKQTFWLNCPFELKSFSPKLSTVEYPIRFQWAYDEEMIEGEVMDLHILTNPKGELSTADGMDATLSDIAIPTVTTKSNEMYGDWATYKSDDHALCFGYDRVNQAYKRPYFLAAYNGKDEILPSAIRNKNSVDDAKDLDLFFRFHLIDKVLRIKTIAWAYVNNMHYFFNPSEIEINENKCGRQVTMPGVVTGFINNGLPNIPITVNDDNDTKLIRNGQPEFTTQTLGPTKLNIWTSDSSVTGDGGLHHENDMPTIRCIIPSDGMDTNVYPKYTIPGYGGGQMTHQLVPNRNDSISISDSACDQSETIYGKLTIILNTDVLKSHATSDETSNILSVKARNGDNKVVYYLIPYTGIDSYPLNNTDIFTENVDGEEIEHGYCYPNTMTWNYDKYGILKHNSVLKDYVDGGVTVPEEYDEDDEVIEDWPKGMSTIGTFSNLRNIPYFVVAETENHCRAFSPVYDFTPFRVTIVFDTINNKIILHPDLEYYIRYFKYRLIGKISDGSNEIDIATEVTPTEGIPTKINNEGELPEIGDNKEYYIKGTTYKVYTFECNWGETSNNSLTLPTEIAPRIAGIAVESGYIIDYNFNGSGQAEIRQIRKIEKITDSEDPTQWEWRIAVVPNDTDTDGMVIENDFSIITVNPNITPSATQYTVLNFKKNGWVSRMETYNPMIKPTVLNTIPAGMLTLLTNPLTMAQEKRDIKANSSIIIEDCLGLVHICDINII